MSRYRFGAFRLLFVLVFTCNLLIACNLVLGQQRRPGKNKPSKKEKSENATKVQAEDPNKLSSAYIELATTMSSPYQLSGSDATSSSKTPFDIIDRHKNNSLPPLKKAFEQWEASRIICQSIAKQSQSKINANQQDFANVLEKALNGELTHEETVASKTPDGSLDFKKVAVDDSFQQLLVSGLVSAARQTAARREAQNEVLKLYEATTVGVWRQLSTDLKSVYHSKQSKDQLVSVHIEPDQLYEKKKSQFRVTNRSKQKLTNVTLILETTHSLYAPDVYNLQGFFIPVWNPDQSIELSTNVYSNCNPKEIEKSRPNEALTGISNFWLMGLGGICDVRIQLWSDEVCQEPRKIHLKQQAERSAEFELSNVAKVVTSELNKGRKKDKKFTITQLSEWCERAIDRVLFLAPDNADIVAKAKLARANPVELANQIDRERKTLCSKVLREGTVYSGVWSVKTKVDNVLRMSGPTFDQDAMLKKHQDDSGDIALLIESFDEVSGKVKAVAFAPENGKLFQQYSGGLLRNQSNDVFLYVNTAEKFSGPKGTFEDSMFHPLKTPGQLEVHIGPDDLLGMHTSESQANFFDLNVRLQKIDGAKLSKAIEQMQASKPSDAELEKLNSHLQAGARFNGNWQLKAEKDLTQEPLFKDSAKVLMDPRTSKGALSMRVAKFDKETRAIEVEFTRPTPRVANESQNGKRKAAPFDKMGTRQWSGVVLFDSNTRHWKIHLPPQARVAKASSSGMGSMGAPVRFNTSELDVVSTSCEIDLDLSDGTLAGKITPPTAVDMISTVLELHKPTSN